MGHSLVKGVVNETMYLRIGRPKYFEEDSSEKEKIISTSWQHLLSLGASHAVSYGSLRSTDANSDTVTNSNTNSNSDTDTDTNPISATH